MDLALQPLIILHNKLQAGAWEAPQQHCRQATPGLPVEDLENNLFMRPLLEKADALLLNWCKL
jgi:hypothetical protein